MYPRLAATTLAALEAEGGAFLDMTGTFRVETRATYAEDAVHYTPLGNRLIAQAVVPLIKERLAAVARISP